MKAPLQQLSKTKPALRKSGKLLAADVQGSKGLSFKRLHCEPAPSKGCLIYWWFLNKASKKHPLEGLGRLLLLLILLVFFLAKAYLLWLLSGVFFVLAYFFLGIHKQMVSFC